MMSGLSYAGSTDGITSIYEFVGVEAGISDYDGITTPTIGLKYGQQSPLWRTALAYNFSTDTEDTFNTLIVQVDRGVLTELFEEFPFKPYIGFSLGVIQHSNSDNKIDNDRGYLYGLNTGMNYVLNNEFDVDISYRYQKTSQLEYVDHSNALSIALHYYFD